MNTNTLKMAELQEAVDFYASVDFDPNQARPLMDLLQAQTDYIQKRFWKMADEAKFIHEQADKRETLRLMGWL
jgi:6-phosphogluconate dehydrogenase